MKKRLSSLFAIVLALPLLVSTGRCAESGELPENVFPDEGSWKMFVAQWQRHDGHAEAAASPKRGAKPAGAAESLELGRFIADLQEAKKATANAPIEMAGMLVALVPPIPKAEAATNMDSAAAEKVLEARREYWTQLQESLADAVRICKERAGKQGRAPDSDGFRAYSQAEAAAKRVLSDATADHWYLQKPTHDVNDAERLLARKKELVDALIASFEKLKAYVDAPALRRGEE